MSSVFKCFSKFVSVCLCAMLVFSCAFAEETAEIGQIGALPTPTPEPISNASLAQAGEQPPTAEAGTDTPTPSPEEQSPSPSVSPTESVIPTQGGEQSTEATPAQGEATQTPAPTSTWDESQCDHTTENCEKAPKCDVEGCEHIGLNENGDVAALCPLGEWLLTVADATQGMESGVSLMAASAPTIVKLKNGVNTIYRSGTYVLTDGGDRAEVHVRDGLAVSLTLQNVELLKLRLMKTAAANLAFEGQNTIETVAAADAMLTIDGTGSLVVRSNFNCDMLNVLGGSVQLPIKNNPDIKSLNGHTQNVFWAGSATEAYVDGDSFSQIQAAADESACLWLPKLREGLAYSSKVSNGKLMITSIPEEPSDQTEFDVSSAEVFTPEKGKAYRLKASQAEAQNKTLTVGVEGVSLSLKGIGSDASKPSIEANQSATLFLSGKNQLGTLGGGATVKLSGDGSLTVEIISANGLIGMGALTICGNQLNESALADWQRVTVADPLSTSVKAKLGKKSIALLFSLNDPQTAYLALSEPKPGYQYIAQRKNDTLNVEEVPAQAQLLTLTDSGLSLASGNYLVRTEGDTSGQIMVQSGAGVTLMLENVATKGGMTIGGKAKVAIQIAGANLLGGALACDTRSELTVSGTGALLVGSASGDSNKTSIKGQVNLSLAKGDKLPGSKLKPTVISVTDNNGASMANCEITLKLGKEEPFTTTTDANGRITLWRSKALTKVDAVVLSASDTFATILSGGSGSPDALPEISEVKHKEYGEVTVAAAGAKTVGIQYYVSSAQREMPDTYVNSAKRVIAVENGVCDIPDLKDGQIVTYRAFASVKESQLAPETADGFAFSEEKQFTVKDARKVFKLKKQTKAYDGKAFDLDTTLLPSGSTIKYMQGEKELDKAPSNVGSYIARITVPAGNKKYLPGVYDVRMEITRIVIEIIPEFASKIQGESDPPFVYEPTDKSKAILKQFGDTITGRMTRKKGEFYGNYPYLLDNLKAINETTHEERHYYELRFAEGSASFFVNWGPHHYMPYDPFKKIDPVYDELLFSNGDTLKVQIRTNEMLKIGDVYYGYPVTDTLDGKARPFTPTLRLRGGYDQALLILTAEPEISEDGGYLTDADGNRMLRGRDLKLSYFMLNHFQRQGIRYIAFSLNGVSVLISVNDLYDGEGVKALMEQNDISRYGASFHIVLEPVDGSSLTEEESAASESASLGESLMRVSAYVQNGAQRADLSPVLVDAQLLFDVSALLPDATAEETDDVTEVVNGRVVTAVASPQEKEEAAAIAGAKGETETTAPMLELAQSILNRELERKAAKLLRYGKSTVELDTKAVVPYTSSEAQTQMFSALLRTRPYLTAPFSQSGLYGVHSQVQ